MGKEFTIDGDVFDVTALPAMRNFKLQALLAPALAELAEVAVEAMAGKANLGDVDVAAKMAPMVARFFHALGPDGLERVTKELLYATTMNGKLLFGDGGTFDVVMRGKTMATWRLLWHALEVNYPDFSIGLDALRKKRAAGAGAGGDPPPVASGSAG